MKRNLIILLLIPFLLTLLGIATINTTFNYISNDIIDIDWAYDDVEAFELQGNRYLLKATGVSEKDYPASVGNELVWSVKNKDGSDQLIASIEQEGKMFYLKTLGLGEVIVTCANKKGNVSRSFTALIIEGTYVLIKPKINTSQNNIDPNIYYGTYDIDNGQKKDAEVEFKIDTNNPAIDLYVKEKTDGIDVDLDNFIIRIKQNASDVESFTLDSVEDEINNTATYSLNIIKGGVNVYTYQDLLDCTNNSSNGEIVVLRKSFESYNNYSMSSSNNVEMFGTIVNSKFNFQNEVYKFKTTMCTDYIDNWNRHSSQKISADVLAGLRVQKDFYGNGYTINFHNLTYPTGVTEVIGDKGEIVKVPTLTSTDLFRGPLPFYTLGNHHNTPLIEALGQDNIGFYVDGNNILVNDVNIKNCDFGNMLSNLRYTGTVLETHGDNITISNSKLSNGKNVIRSYSSMNTIIDNCMLSNAFNFLASVGTNEYIPINGQELFDFLGLDGNITRARIEEYLQENSFGDEILNSYIIGEFTDKDKMKQSLISIQNALNNALLIEDEFKGTLRIEDTLFYRSGIASVSIDTMFNGPYIYGAVPSYVTSLLEMLSVDYVPSRIGGLSYPVKVDIVGSTKFYDYKTKDDLDISGLINENISKFATDAGEQIGIDYDGTITIDTIFPLKSYLFDTVPTYNVEDRKYINIPIAFYGGSSNKSIVNIDTLDMKDTLTNEIKVDLLDKYLLLTSNNTYGMLKNAMLRCVTIVIGFEPFKFICTDDSGYLFGETPQVSELVENAKRRMQNETNN